MEGTSIVRLVATGVLVTEELAGVKLAAAMQEENKEVKREIRSPIQIGGNA